MKTGKEITIAIVIGLIFGLVVVGGIIRAKRALDRARNNSQVQVAREPSPTAQSTSNLPLELTTPDNQVTDTGTFTVAGKTDPQGYLVILGEKGEYITTPTSTGNFSQEISLVKGANTIIVTVYLENGTKAEKPLTVIYTNPGI